MGRPRILWESWGFHKWGGIPKWKVYKGYSHIPIKIDDLGVPLFQETTICLMVKLSSLTPPFGYFVNTKIKPDFFKSIPQFSYDVAGKL
jgi:hypothetical protein